jgi:hypothetical protein
MITMIKIKPQHHPLLIPVLSFLMLALVISILILAAFTNNTVFWIVAVLFDVGIAFVGVRIILNMRKPKLISKPLGDQLKFGEQTSPESEPEVVETE